MRDTDTPHVMDTYLIPIKNIYYILRLQTPYLLKPLCHLFHIFSGIKMGPSLQMQTRLKKFGLTWK
jgi:hypothetical protein